MTLPWVSSTFQAFRLAPATVILLLSVGCSQSVTPVAVTSNDDETIGTVTLEIVKDTDPSATPLRTIPITEGQTLESIMRGLGKDTTKPIEVAISGSGVTAFVQSIDSITTNADRGWTYTINGEFATEGIGSVQLKPGQEIQWRFTTFEEAMKP